MAKASSQSALLEKRLEMAQFPTDRKREESTGLAPLAREAEYTRGSTFSPAVFGVYVKGGLVLVSHIHIYCAG